LRKESGWSGFRERPSSVEETALAVEALAGSLAGQQFDPSVSIPQVKGTVEFGAKWLIHRVTSGQWLNASPIGFYFANLWYYERRYPMIFTVGALSHTAAACDLIRQRTMPK
jgi:squalene-hopene/tetraprenyl-beta-curcumene cyclase